MLGKTENWRVCIFWASFEGWAVSGFVKKLGIGSPSQSTFRFFYLGGPVKCWVRQRTGFPYPKEIILALHFDRYCLEIKKGNTCFSD